MLISRGNMKQIATENSLRNIQFNDLLKRIKHRADGGEFYLLEGIGDDLVDRLRAQPHCFIVEVDRENPFEPCKVRWD